MIPPQANAVDVEQPEPCIRIRMATPEDASSIASILHESFVEYESLYTREAFAATTPGSDQIAARLNEGATWVAVQDENVVGTVSAVQRDKAVLYVRSMAVAPAARGQGVGELLLKQVESFALARGTVRLILSSTPFLHRALRLYERFGFQRRGADDLFGTPLITMWKTLQTSTPKASQ